jgi:hypothetical protein
MVEMVGWDGWRREQEVVDILLLWSGPEEGGDETGM